MKRHYRIPLLLCSLCTASLTAVAQNTTNLPTSMYGVGELSAGDGGRYAGMGNTGIALNRTGFLNTLNPAAIPAWTPPASRSMWVYLPHMPATPF